jgi:hypothetical protein
MKALAGIDEITRDLRNRAAADASVEVLAGAPGHERLGALAGRSPWRLGDLIAALEGPLRDAADEVLLGLQSGAVRVLPPPGEE